MLKGFNKGVIIEMTKQKEIIAELAEEYDSFYLYDETIIIESTEKLKVHFPRVEFLYSMKCNANPSVTKSVFTAGFGADAASLGEVNTAFEHGLPKGKIFFSAPGKTVKDIKAAIKKSHLIADSIGEIERIQSVAEELNEIIEIGVRINPDFSFCGDKIGQPSKFGIDEEQIYEFVSENNYRNIKIAGLHVHVQSQELDASTIAEYHKNVLSLAEKFQNITGIQLKYLNMGSGMGIQYSNDSQPLDIAFVSKSLEKHLSPFCEKYPDMRIMIESGRYAVGKSGTYFTKVLDKKTSHGKTYLILKNTLNGFIRPSMEQFVLKYSADENPAAGEPMFTCRSAFEIFALKDETPEETVTLVGNLCAAADVIAEDIPMPCLNPGDIIGITNAGSYAAVLSPFQFSSHEKPAEIFLTKEGETIIWK